MTDLLNHLQTTSVAPCYVKTTTTLVVYALTTPLMMRVSPNVAYLRGHRVGIQVIVIPLNRCHMYL